MKHLIAIVLSVSTLTGCISPSLQSAANSLVAGNLTPPDHYSYAGPYQFAVRASTAPKE